LENQGVELVVLPWTVVRAELPLGRLVSGQLREQNETEKMKEPTFHSADERLRNPKVNSANGASQPGSACLRAVNPPEAIRTMEVRTARSLRKPP